MPLSRPPLLPPAFGELHQEKGVLGDLSRGPGLGCRRGGDGGRRDTAGGQLPCPAPRCPPGPSARRGGAQWQEAGPMLCPAAQPLPPAAMGTGPGVSGRRAASRPSPGVPSPDSAPCWAGGLARGRDGQVGARRGGGGGPRTSPGREGARSRPAPSRRPPGKWGAHRGSGAPTGEVGRPPGEGGDVCPLPPPRGWRQRGAAQPGFCVWAASRHPVGPRPCPSHPLLPLPGPATPLTPAGRPRRRRTLPEPPPQGAALTCFPSPSPLPPVGEVPVHLLAVASGLSPGTLGPCCPPPVPAEGAMVGRGRGLGTWSERRKGRPTFALGRPCGLVIGGRGSRPGTSR